MNRRDILVLINRVNVVASELKAVLKDIRAGAKVKNLDSLLKKHNQKIPLV